MTMKKKIFRSNKYLDFVRSLPCYSCGAPNAEAHHTETGGMGIKGHDLSCIPLCRPCHSECHQLGRYTFMARRGVEFGIANRDTLRLYIESLASLGRKQHE